MSTLHNIIEPEWGVYLKKLHQIKGKYVSSLVGVCNYKKLFNGGFLNTSLFQEVTQESFLMSESDIQQKIDNLKVGIKVLYALKRNPQRNFLLKNYRGTLLRFCLLRYTLQLEFEKAFPEKKSDFSLDEKKISFIEFVLYGSKISYLESETQEIWKIIIKKYFSSSQNTQQKYKKYFSDLCEKCSWPIDSTLPDSLVVIEEIFQKELPIEQVVKIFQKVIEFYDLDDKWWVEIRSDAKNVNVVYAQKKVIFPENILFYSKQRVLELIDHEVEVHLIRGENNYQNFYTPCEWYLQIEEGFAFLKEREIFYSDVEIEPTVHQISVFMAEVFCSDELKLFFEFYADIVGMKEEVKKIFIWNRILRIKTFHSFYSRWANQKDRSYYMWLKQVMSAKNNVTNFEELFYIWKLSLKDIKNISRNTPTYYSWKKTPYFLWSMLKESIEWNIQNNQNLFSLKQKTIYQDIVLMLQ